MNQLVLKKKNELMKKKKGFTLVELIIVIAVIAVLAAIAIPKFGAVRNNANKSADVANAKNIAAAVSKAIANDEVNYSTEISGAALNSVGGADIASQIDGITKDTKLKTKEYNTSTFVVDVDTSGNVKVKSSGEGGKELYPTTNEVFIGK